MSLQPCLPVPKKGRGRRFGNKEKQDNSTKDGNNAIHSPEKQVTFTTIDDLQSLNVMDYMASVRNEAEGMPDVFVSKTSITNSNDVAMSVPNKNDANTIIDGSAAACFYFCKEEATAGTTPIPISKQWMDGICLIFSQLRQYISTCHQAGVGLPPRRIPVPPSKHSLDWHIFCLGKNEAYGNTHGYYDDDEVDDESSYESSSCNSHLDNHEEANEEENASFSNSTLNTWDRNSVPVDGHTPTVALLCQMDQVLTRRVLSHLIHYLVEDGWEMTHKRGQWIYALLARLEKPLHREECSLLYSLLKHLCQIVQQKPTTTRVGYTENKTETTAIIRTIMVIITVYFEQASQSQIFNIS